MQQAGSSASETEVTWEDQQNINKFGRLNNRLHELDDEIKIAKKTTFQCSVKSDTYVVTADHENAEDMVKRNKKGEPLLDKNGNIQVLTPHTLEHIFSGTVTQISSMSPPEEAQKASKRVHDVIDERQQQLNQLKGFIGDNVGLTNLVRKLPDETHHNIIVPFGKAALFPGRLIHTNELMVLLGEGYYAERTSKQTVEILKRRGKSLETQVESLKAIMQDLKAEAAFFDTTAEEAAEGLLEIREDYVAEDSFEKSAGCGIKTESALGMGNIKAADEEDEDEEYKRLEMVMNKLEKEEEEAERACESDGDEQIQNEPVSTTQSPIDQEVRSSRVPKVRASEVTAVSKAFNNSTMRKALELPQYKEKVEAPPPATNINMAFTDSIVECTNNNIGMQLSEQQSGAHSSRPVSRFKMQRKGS